MQRVVSQKTSAQLAHDALHGIIYQSVPPYSRTPPPQTFMNEGEFKRFITRKLPDAQMPNFEEKDADAATISDKLSTPKLGQSMVQRAAAMEDAARSHVARLLSSQTHITGNAVPVNHQCISHSAEAPRIAPFPSDRPPLPLILQKGDSRKVFSHIPACVAGNMSNLADCLIKWHQKVGGKITDLLKMEFWSSRSVGTKPFFCVEQSHFGFRRIYKVEVDIPTIKEMPGLGGKWTFFYMTGKQWQQYPDVPEQVMAILIAREFTTRQALGFPMNSPVRFRKGEHFVVAFPSSSVSSRQEYYHGLAVDRIYVSHERGKQRADETTKSRADAMRKAKSIDPLVYRVETIDIIRGGKLPLMDGYGSHAQLYGFDRLGKEFGDGTLRMQYWEKRVVSLESV